MTLEEAVEDVYKFNSVLMSLPKSPSVYLLYKRVGHNSPQFQSHSQASSLHPRRAAAYWRVVAKLEHDTEKAPRDNLNSKTVFPSMIYSWMLLCVFKATFVILFRMQTEDIALLSTHFNNDFLSSSKDSLFCYRANTKSCKGTRQLFFFALVGDLLTGRQRHSIEPVTGFFN